MPGTVECIKESIAAAGHITAHGASQDMENGVKEFAVQLETLVDRVVSGELAVELTQNADKLVSGFIQHFEDGYSKLEVSPLGFKGCCEKSQGSYFPCSSPKPATCPLTPPIHATQCSADPMMAVAPSAF